MATSMRNDRAAFHSFIDSQLSYEGRWHPRRFTGMWNFMQKVDAGIGNSHMDDKEPHTKSRCQSALCWNVCLELDSSIYQYTFTLIGGDKINKELVTVASEINNIRETISGEMFISGNNFSFPPKRFRIRSIKSADFSSPPYFTLELKPTFLDGEMLISSPLGVALCRAVTILPGSSGPGIERIRELFADDFPAKEATNLFCHLILLAFYGYYITTNPTDTSRTSLNMGQNRAAHNLRDHAKALEKQIDAKFHPSISLQRPTRRRAGIAQGMAREAEHLQEVQRAMRALADAHEAGTIPEILRHIKNKPQIEDILTNGPSGRLRTAGVSDQGYQKAKKKLLELCDKPLVIPKDVEIRRMEAPLIGLKIPGFFVTPHKLAAHMVALAMIKPGMSVLEPSAGSGNIADAIREAGVGGKMDVLEYSPSLVKILEAKGHHVVGYDFLKHTLLYDRIVMNPPFERGQDVDHVRHAYECLKPGGRLVAIMGEHPFFGEDVKSVDFREWFNGLSAWDEKLLPGTFSNQVTSTDVSGRLVSIDKEA